MKHSLSSKLGRPVVPPRYSWGSGFYHDIADIRRRVYSTYYVRVELRALLAPILGKSCSSFLDQVLDEIENPRFSIDAKRYEEVAAYLWRRSRSVFPAEIAAWEREKDRRAIEDAVRLIDAFGDQLAPERLLSPEGIRRAVLTSCWTSLPDALPDVDAWVRLDGVLAREGQPDGINVPIDFTRLLTEQVFERPCRLVVLPGDLANLACDLQLYGQSLIARWIAILARTADDERALDLRALAETRGVRITFLANENFTPRNNNLLRLLNPTAKNLRDLLALPTFSRLRGWHDAGLFELRTFRSEYHGTVLSDLGEEAAITLAGADCVVATGEPNNLTLNGLGVPCFRIAPIRDFAHVFLAGIKLDREGFRHPRFSVLYAPPGVSPAIGWEPDQVSRLTGKQFFDLYRALPAVTWVAIVEKAPAGGNVLRNYLKTRRQLSTDEVFDTTTIHTLIESSPGN